MSAAVLSVSTFDRPITIVIDGGPASGKSELIKRLRVLFPSLIFVSEAATAVFGAGYPLPFDGISQDLVETQATIFNFQRGLERMALRDAILGKVKIIILDRATISGEAYMPGGAKEFYEQVACAPKEELMGQYDEVWGCRSLASFDEDAYNRVKATNPHRAESARQAAVMDQKTQSVWQSHPGYHLLPSEQGLQAMMEMAVARIQSYIFSEIERRWVVPLGGLAQLLAKYPEMLVKTTRINQGYFWDDSNTRLRREDDVYHFTDKAGVGLERVEFDPFVPKATFDKLWPKTVGLRIVKDRHYLVGGYEHDVYLDDLEGLETIERSFMRRPDAEAFALDARLLALSPREVTGQEEWGNHSLAVHGLPAAALS